MADHEPGALAKGSAAGPDSPWQADNGKIQLTVHPNGCLEAVEVTTGVRWQPDPWHHSPAEVVLKPKTGSHGAPEAAPEGALADFQSSLAQPSASIRLNLGLARSRSVRGLSDLACECALEGFVHESGEVAGRLVYEVRLDASEPRFELAVTEFWIESADYRWEELHLPPRSFGLRLALDEGYLVWPRLGQGLIFPVGGADTGVIQDGKSLMWSYGQLPFQTTSKPSMAWFGAVNGQSAWCAIVETPDDSLLHVIGNDKIAWDAPRLASIHPAWLSSHGALSYRRVVAYTFLPGGDYVAMAKLYRRYLRERGQYKSLRAKAADLPAIAKLVGAPMIWLDPGFMRTANDPEANPRYVGTHRVTGKFSAVPERLRLLQQHGLEKAYINLEAWERLGVAYQEPDHWPPNEELGGLEEFKKLFSSAMQAEFPGYLLGFYNIYNDMYRDAPSFDWGRIIKTHDGRPLYGGYWHGGLCYIICPTQYIPLAEPHFREYQHHLNLQSMLFDNFIMLKECYDPEHPLTRSEERQTKCAFLDYTVAHGWVTGVEFAADWATPHLHYIDGGVGFVGGLGRQSTAIMTSHENCIPAPLWDLVFHDSVVNYWWHWNTLSCASSFYLTKKAYTWVEQALQDILCANPGAWWLNPDNIEYWAKLIGQIGPIHSRLSESLAYEEMTGHRYLSPNRLVQETLWSDGTRIAVNFDDSAFEAPGWILPAKGFAVAGSPKLGTMKGSLRQDLRVSTSQRAA
jgi:hypothetical protein